MKQTAVEWLEDNIERDMDYLEILYLIKQAKEMEKEQVIEAHFNGCERGEMFNNENRAFITDSEQYYNQTFKSE